MSRKGTFSHLLKHRGLESTLFKSDRASAQQGQEEDSLSDDAAVFCHFPCPPAGLWRSFQPPQPQDSGVGGHSFGGRMILEMVNSGTGWQLRPEGLSGNCSRHSGQSYETRKLTQRARVLLSWWKGEKPQLRT